MRKIIFIFSILLSSLCASLAQVQTYTVTWKVNGVQFAQNQTKDGKINLEDIDDPDIEGDLEFAGWTAYESYSDFDAPDDIFDYFSDDEDLPTIASNSTFYAVFAEFDDEIEEYFNYTTDYLEDLIFITNDTVISLEDAIADRILFIKNKDERIENIILGSESFSPDWGIAQPKYNSTNQGTFLTRITSPGDYWIEFSTIEDWRYRQVIKKHISFKVRDNCTVEYVGFDPNWCPETTSRGGEYNLGSTFRISPSLPNDPQGLNRELIYWRNTNEEGKGRTYQIGEEIIINDDIKLYPQWKWEINTTYTAIDNLKNTDVFLNSFGNLIIGKNSRVIIKSLTLQGGLDFEKGGYSMPSLYITEHKKTALQKNNIIVDFNITIDNRNYYPFAVPFPVAVSDIDYADPTLAAASTYGTHYVIKRYDGALRAENGANRDQNWVQMNNESDTLQPGVGYIITAVPVDGKAVIRIPLHFDNDWTKQGEQSIGDGLNREEVSVSAHSGAAATAAPIHSGWNFIANPYLAKYDGNNIANAPKYANIPRYDFSAYDQVLLSTVTLSPEYPFFVQVGSDATLNFATTGRRQAPAAVRANSSNQTVSATFHLVQTDNQTLDHTSIILNEQHTPAYEINADLEKMFGSAYTTSLYSISQDYRLAFNALSFTDAQTPIPFGFRAAEAGNYTIVLTNPEDMAGMESVLLYDNHTHQTTNLLYFDYTFHTERTQDDTRFTIQFISRNNTTTDIEDLHIYPTSTTKFIHNNQLYITREGKIYNAVGEQVK